MGFIKDDMDRREAKGRAEDEASALLRSINNRLRRGVLETAEALRELDEMVATGDVSVEAADQVRRALLPH